MIDNQQISIHQSNSRTTLDISGGVREVARLAIPVVLTNISITTMQIVDSIMVGELGAPELASVGFGGIWLWTLMCFFVGTTTCVQTFVAQHYGAQEFRECGTWAWQGIYALVPMAMAMGTALFVGAHGLIELLEPDAAIAPHASDYLRVRALGTPGLVAAVALSSFFRGLGDTRTPLYTTVAANLLNVLLDYGLIFGNFGLPALGVRGAGIATSMAEWTNFLILLMFFQRSTIARNFASEIALPDRDRMLRLLRIGLPVGAQWWLEMTSFAAFLTLVARMGAAPMAASQAFIALLSISFMQAQGIAIAVSTLVAQYIGANDHSAAERSLASGMRLCVVLTAMVAALLTLGAEPLLRLFSDDPRVLAIGRPLMWIGAVFQVFDGLAIIADGGLRGAGDTTWPMFVRFGLAWFLFLPLAYGLGIHLELGLSWAWGGGVVYVIALTGALMQRFRSGHWKQLKILLRPMPATKASEA